MGECVISLGIVIGGYCCGELIMCLVFFELVGVYCLFIVFFVCFWCFMIW